MQSCTIAMKKTVLVDAEFVLNSFSDRLRVQVSFMHIILL